MPTLLPGSPPASPPESPDSHHSQSPRVENETDVSSDATKLRAIHNTQGYRNGIGDAKSSKLQQGFDEGFLLGAELGALVGRILGVLDGLVISGREVRVLRERAMEQLGLKSVFGREYFGEDGVWRWEVGVRGDGGGDGEVTVRDVAGAHPLIGRWVGEVGEVARGAGLGVDGFDTMDRSLATHS